ncbi:polymorphic toxin-type HINT domain-containing protein, partial [Streptomyces sp. NPDC055078]
CKQAWRWNLDHVKDARGNVMSYYYGAETNHYALNGKTDVNGTAYTRGGYLKRIDYGQRAGAVHTTKAPARVVFRTEERCLPDAAFDCAESKFTAANAARWPDTPVDRNCRPGTKCTITQASPTFWTTKRLTGITTQMSTGPAATDWADVDAWTLTHFFTDNGDDTKTLWLSKIGHEGRANHLGQGGGPIALPSLDLGGEHRKNRVDSATDNIDAIHRFRLATVLSETGAQLDVTYAPADCTPATLPQPGSSTKRCYPVKWMPPGAITERTDWFHKYVVAEITETDRTGGGEDLVTQYAYNGPAGWRHAERDGITDDKFLTWGQWQGYGQVTVLSGSRQNLRTRIDYTYLQGLHGDKAPGGGTRTEQVTDSTGAVFTGHKEYTGFELEAKTYDNGQVIAKSINEPWKHDTATRTRPMGSAPSIVTKATIVKPRVTRGYSLLGNGTWRTTKSVSEFETTGRTGRLTETNDLGDLSTAGDDTCTRLWYADNPALNLVDLPSRSESLSVACTVTPDRSKHVIKDERTAYDKLAVGAAPTRGEATQTERLTAHNGTAATYQITGTTEYDLFGRPTLQRDAKLAETKTAYTDVNGLISQTKVTNALNHITTTDYAPAWGASTGQTDPNGKRTDLAYDALGRLTSVWFANRPKSLSPSIKHSYNVRRDDVVAIKTEKLENDSTYGVEYQHYDSFLRPRQKQTEGPNGSRMIGEVFYDGAGKIKKVNETFNALGAPQDRVATVANGEVGGQTVTEYDALGRPTAEIFQIAGVEQWRTTTAYEGDRTHVDPPTGKRPTTTITDAQGRATELRHYNTPSPLPNGPGSQYDTTTYTHTSAGQLETVTDAANNVWRYEYDQLGRKTKSIDPDAGVSTTVYDELDRPVSTTDARAKTTSTVYDQLGRPKTTWEGAPVTGTKLTETYYDKAGWLGHAWASLRYINATQYFATITKDMDALYRVEKVDHTVPTTEGALAGTYTFTSTYNPDGTVKSQGMPGAGALGGEAIAFGYDDLQRPTSMTGHTPYVSATQYTPTSQLKALHLSNGTGRKVQQSFTYERGTDRLTRAVVDIEGVTGPAKASNYSYDQSGNVLSIADTSGLSPDVQCFSYSNRQTLAEAWTPGATATEADGSGTVGGTGTAPAACAAAPGTKALGGPAPYWKSYETDAIGNRVKDVTHDTGLDATKNVTRNYTYGEGPAGPHALTRVDDTSAPGKPTTFAYDASGNLDARTTDNKTQDFQWNGSGELTKVVEADATETDNIYDASGNRVLRRDKNATTVYLPGMELRLPKNGTAVEATRYYSFGGQSIAVRQNDNQLSFLVQDHHGTGEQAINAATSAVSQRRFDPFGMARGQDAGTWPGEKGFVGGTIDTSTGLTHLGAREYDAKLGRFISVDPVIDYSLPEQLNAYAYAYNSPVTLSDPTGLVPSCAGGKPGWMCEDQQTAPEKAEAEVDHAHQQVTRAKGQQTRAKKRIATAGKALVKIVKQLIGVDAAMDCFSSGDLAACGETLLNVAGSFAGGLAGKILAKYGVPWNWAKGAKLAKRVAGLVGDLIGGVRSYFKAGDAIAGAMSSLDKAKGALAVARVKAKAAAAKADAALAKLMKKDRCHSFLPGTLVLLADGTKKPIEAVKPGDRVTVTDPETGETTTREVADTIVTEDDKEFVDLTIRAKSGDPAELVSTTTHPFWVNSEDKWVEAGDLWPGMTLRTPGGETVTVEGARSFEERQRTYDLSIDEIHTYYVLAGAVPVLVHNCDAPGHTADVDIEDVNGDVRLSYSVRSGNASDPEKALGGGYNTEAATHTENRVARMSGASAGKNPILGDPYAGIIAVNKGETVRLFGQRPPCPRCRGAMNRMVNELGVNVVYSWASPLGAGDWTANGGRRRR